MADMSQDDLDSIFGGEEGSEPPPAEVSSEESVENLFGGGYDSWGFGTQNGSFGHNDTPSSYIWDLGDGNSSSLKNPVHPFTKQGNYLIGLIVRDQGGFYSEPITWNISVNDTTPPIPQISIDGVIMDGSLEVYTGQRIQFSAS